MYRPGRELRICVRNGVTLIGLRAERDGSTRPGSNGVVGAANALTYHIPPLSAAIMGYLRSGVFRDVLAGERSIILRPELYVTAAAMAASVFVVLVSFGMDPAIAVALAVTMGFGLCALAIVKQLSLPSYRGRGGLMTGG
jgi:uncharacterized membrane protein YeiH